MSGGAGNYGQCVPLEGGVVLDSTRLNRVLAMTPGRMLCEAGALIADLDRAARGGSHGVAPQEILMYPSTRDIATIGGFIAGGYAGAGSIRNGILKDPGNVSLIRVVTLEETPRIITLRDADIQKVHHAFGTNGIITQLEIALKPAVEWLHHITLFPDDAQALSFGASGGVSRAGRALWRGRVAVHDGSCRQGGGPAARIDEIIREFEADGCLVFNPHVYTIEDGGMKTIDMAQIDFKKIAGPHGLMNPGKTRGWTAGMAVP